MKLNLTSLFAAVSLIGYVNATSQSTLHNAIHSGIRPLTSGSGVPYERLNKNDTVSKYPHLTKWLTNSGRHKVLLIVDHQVGLYEAVRDFDPTVYRNNMMAHAALGKLFNLPVIMTTSAETGMLVPFTG